MDAHLAYTEGGLERQSPKEQSPARLPGILIVEDDPAVSLFLAVGLRQAQFAVWTTAEGTQAVPLYEAQREGIDLVLLDIHMPGWDGPRTLAALHAVNPELPYCFMTGYAGIYSEEELLRQGALYIFRKPFRVAEVAEVLRRLVQLGR